MDTPPVTDQATFCATLLDEWVRAGVTDVVVAPGSRSTPMALAMSGEPRVRLHVHHDERSAGFLALGLGLATGRPAPVVVTSGTAAVELHPAVVEAHQARVPMIVCTADRPPELHHVGAPQTVDQTRLYGPAARWFVDPGVPDAAASGTWRSLAARAVIEACGPVPGPVQLNLAFRDPLVGRPGELPAGRPDGSPWHVALGSAGVPAGRAEAASATLAAGADAASGSQAAADLATRGAADLAARLVGRRGVVIAGAGCAGCADDVHALAAALGWPVIADPRSGCRTPAPTTVAHADALLRHPRFADAHAPQVVLQLGQPPASKVVGQWLAASGAEIVVVDAPGGWFDPDHRATAVVRADPHDVVGPLGVAVHALERAPVPGWLEAWTASDARAAAAVDAVLAARSEPTEPGTARSLVGALPDGASLVVSSSMPVRDVEWWSAPRPGLRVLANRGANGIDGVVSTAVGVALAGGPTALLIGDVALLHDANGLLGLARRSVDLVIVVVDNDGGGIFSFLPQAAQLDPERFEQLFGTPHGVDVAALAAVHGIDARVVDRAADLGPAVSATGAAGGVHLLVVRTERAANVALHAALQRAVGAALT